MVTLMMDTDNCSFKSKQKMPFCHISTKEVGMLKNHFLLQLYLCNFSLKCHAEKKFGVSS